MLNGPRVAFLADSFHEINGQALTSRELVRDAQRRRQPMLSVRFGAQRREWLEDRLRVLELARGWATFSVERDLGFDLMWWRYLKEVEQAVRDFQAEVVHITSPGDLGQLGALVAHRLKLPLVISWHTHLHEFGAARLDRCLRWAPDGVRRSVVGWSERQMTRALMRFHRLGRALLAPNLELVAWLEKQTGKPAFLMPRGIDTDLFHPRRRAPRDAGGEPDVVRLGFVGRLSSEKNVELLAAVERELIRAGLGNYRFLIVGDGSQRAWLGANLQRADFTGLLRGEDLARAYASMDVFLFPSRTDSFGNVIAEALASGTPCVVTNQGGPQYQVREGITGVIAASDEAFVASARGFVENPGRARAMRAAAREAALGKSWAAAFDPVWNVYQAVALTESATKRQPVLAQPALSVATPATVTKPETTIKPAAAKAAAA